VTTLVIDSQTLPEPLFSIIGKAASRIRVVGDANEVILTPTTEPDGPDDGYIDPADYANDTEYLNALPGVAERLISYNDLPRSEFRPAPRKFFNV